MADMRFDNRVAIITGGGGSLGRSHALMLARRGCNIVLNDVGGSFKGEGSDKGPAQKVVDEIKALGVKCVANFDDIGSKEGGKNVVKAAIDNFGRVDIVINNAGIIRDVSFHKMSEEDWDKIYSVHVKGVFNVTHAAWPHMRDANYGRIVMTTSGAGLWGNFGQVNYSSAKMAQVGMMNTLKIEGKKHNIKVNTIAPIAKSRMTETVMPPPMLAKFQPEAISAMVTYLCSEECEESGAIYEGGGGYYTRVWICQHPGTYIPVEQVTAEKFRDEVRGKIADATQSKAVPGLQEATMGIMKHIKF